MATIKYKEDEQGNKKVIIKEIDGVQKASCVCCTPCVHSPVYLDFAWDTGTGLPYGSFKPESNGEIKCYRYKKVTVNGLESYSYSYSGPNSETGGLTRNSNTFYIYDQGQCADTGGSVITSEYNSGGYDSRYEEIYANCNGIFKQYYNNELANSLEYEDIIPEPIGFIYSYSIVSPTRITYTALPECPPDGGGYVYTCSINYTVTVDLYNEIPE